jgi:hypothetical protein
VWKGPSLSSKIKRPPLLRKGRDPLLKGPAPLLKCPALQWKGTDPLLKGPAPLLKCPALLRKGPSSLLENPAFYVVDNEVFFAGQRLVPDIYKKNWKIQTR